MYNSTLKTRRCDRQNLLLFIAYPLLNPKTSPDINPKAAAIDNPTDPVVEGSFWKCDAILLSAWIP